MTRINLLKRRKMTVDEFKTWLNQLILDKKGALPDLNDWKKIKENLDRVQVLSYTNAVIKTTLNGKQIVLGNTYESEENKSRVDTSEGV